MKTETTTFANIFKNLQTALADGQKREDELTAELSVIQEENARAKKGLEAMSNGQSVETATTKAKKLPAAPSPAPAKVGRKGAKKEPEAASSAPRKSGERPTMKESMAAVMGKAVMTAGEIVEALEKKGWAPNASNPQSYVSYMLSSNKDVFESVSRGKYKLIEGAAVARKPRGRKKGTTTTAAATKSSKKKNHVDTELEDLGVGGESNISANPFAAQ